MVRIGMLVVWCIGWTATATGQESAEGMYNRIQRAAARPAGPDEQRVLWSEVPAREFDPKWTPSAQIGEVQLIAMLKDGRLQRTAAVKESVRMDPKARREFVAAIKADPIYWPTMLSPLKIGSAGVLRTQPWMFRAPLVVDVINVGNVVVKMDGEFILIRGLSTAGVTDGKLFSYIGPMIVAETKLVGNKTMFVLEPLLPDAKLLAKAKKTAKVK